MASLSWMNLMAESISATLLGGSSFSFWNWLITSIPWVNYSSYGFYYFFFGLMTFLGYSSRLLFLDWITTAPPFSSFCHSLPNLISPGAFSRLSSYLATGLRLWQQLIKVSQRSISTWLGLRLMKASLSFSSLSLRYSSFAFLSSSAFFLSSLRFSYSSFSLSLRFSYSSFSFFLLSSSSLRFLIRSIWSETQPMYLRRSCWSSKASMSRTCLSIQSSILSSSLSFLAYTALIFSSYSFLISYGDFCTDTTPSSVFFCCLRTSSSALMASAQLYLWQSSVLMDLSSLQRMSIWSFNLLTSDSISMPGLAFCRARLSSLISLLRRCSYFLLMSAVVNCLSFSSILYLSSSTEQLSLLLGLRSSLKRVSRISRSADTRFLTSLSPFIYLRSWFSVLNLSLIAPEYCEIAFLPVFLLSVRSRSTLLCSSSSARLSAFRASRSAFSLSRPQQCFSLLGFSSSFLGASGILVYSVISSLLQLNSGLGFLGGRSFLGRTGWAGRLSSCCLCFSAAYFSIFSLYCGCQSSGFFGSTNPFSTSSFSTYLGIIYDYIDVVKQCFKHITASKIGSAPNPAPPPTAAPHPHILSHLLAPGEGRAGGGAGRGAGGMGWIVEVSSSFESD